MHLRRHLYRVPVAGRFLASDLGLALLGAAVAIFAVAGSPEVDAQVDPLRTALRLR